MRARRSSALQSATLVLAGHQPELFHPGVWVKNFALNGLAHETGSIPLNLVVDNDTAKSTTLLMPAEGHVLAVPFDHWQSEVPYEERGVQNEALFRAVPTTAAKVSGAWNFRSMLPEFWDEACRQGERTALLGERFAAARRTFERRWGCTNLEVPLSRVCQTEGFAWFACHLLQNLRQFGDVYNSVVRAYRLRYHMRSRNHPVPDLRGRGTGWKHRCGAGVTVKNSVVGCWCDPRPKGWSCASVKIGGLHFDSVNGTTNW